MKWNADGIAKLSDGDIKSLRQNAARLNNDQVVSLCDIELARRKPAKPPKSSGAGREDRAGQYVSELHFVCPGELGVARQEDGTIVTGTWVVSADVAELGRKHSSIVALHASRAELSYLQGEILSWEVKPRQNRYTGEDLNKTREGIDFTLRLTADALPWKGEATGEKGYAWSPLPDRSP